MQEAQSSGGLSSFFPASKNHADCGGPEPVAVVMATQGPVVVLHMVT